MKTFYLQAPPTGIWPQARIPDPDLSWIYDVHVIYEGRDPCWRPVTSRGQERWMAGHGAEAIPDCLAQANRITVMRDHLDALIQERPDGAIGFWTRGLFGLPSSDVGIVYDLTFGMLWHPDPEAFTKCRAQEESAKAVSMMQETFKEPTHDLTWRRLGDSFEHLWWAIKKTLPRPKVT